MERTFKKGDIVQHFKREKMTEEQLEKEPNLYLYETPFNLIFNIPTSNSFVVHLWLPSN